MPGIIPRSLKEKLEKRQIIPFVGAGASRSVKLKTGEQALPAWKDLLKEGASLLTDEGKLSASKFIEYGVDSGQDFLLLAQAIRKSISGPTRAEFLTKKFDLQRPLIDEDSLALPRAIWGMINNFIVTTNYDNILSWSAPNGDARILGSPLFHVGSLRSSFPAMR